MFTNLCLVLLLLFADSPVPKFLFQLKKKKTREKSRKRSDKVQFGRWRDSFNSALCSLLSWSTLFQFPVGLLAQLVECCTGIAEVMGSNPVQAWIFFRPYFHYCLGSAHYCEDHFHSHNHPILHDIDSKRYSSFCFQDHNLHPQVTGFLQAFFFCALRWVFFKIISSIKRGYVYPKVM